MEHDGNDPTTQFYRWGFMADVSRIARDIAQAKLMHGEKVDARKAFELAIVELLKLEMYTKDDLASLSSLLMLGSYACKQTALRTQGFALRFESETQPDGPEPGPVQGDRAGQQKIIDTDREPPARDSVVAWVPASIETEP